MGFLKASDHKAIGWYCDEFNLKVQMSTPPIMHFKNTDGEEVSANLFNIINLYKQNKPKNKKVNS